MIGKSAFEHKGRLQKKKKKVGIFHPRSDPRQPGHPRRVSWKKKIKIVRFYDNICIKLEKKNLGLTPASQRWKIPTFFFFFLKPSLIPNVNNI